MRQQDGQIIMVGNDTAMLLKMVEVDGVYFPTFFERNRPMREQIDAVQNLQMRSDDVLLCAYPKPGKTGFVSS